MRFNSIIGNLFISDNESWGNYDREVVHDIINTIEINFSAALCTEPYSSCRCMIDHWEDNPEIRKLTDCHFIYLSSKGNYWCQWIYQFAHEYCHHLINGEMTGEIVGLKWFEETLCELSSMYHLQKIYDSWHSFPLFSEQYLYSPSLQGHIRNIYSDNYPLYAASTRPGFLCSWLPILEQSKYHRDYYNALAFRMLPLFLDNPHLWKIILHIGDSRQWDSLEDLFAHLRQTADDSYSHSLEKLENLLFS